MYVVEVGRYKGAYRVRNTFKNEAQAILYFNAINVGNGYKKRLKRDEKVIARVIT